MPKKRPPRRVAKFLPKLNFSGLCLGLAFFCLSLTPSLLPRSWLLQGIISGISAVIGYGIGVLASYVLRKLVRREVSASFKLVAWRALIIIAILSITLALSWSYEWQQSVRNLMGMQPTYSYHWLGVLILAVSIFALFLFLARFIRLLSRKLKGLLSRFIPAQVATVIAAFLVSLLLFWVLRSLVLGNMLRYANNSFSVINGQTTSGVNQPSVAEASGSPSSLVAWETLGKKGRDFSGRINSAQEITQFTGRPAIQPIRVYVGLESAPNYQAQAELAVAELERTGGFSRKVLAVVTTTGTGWVDPDISDSLEFMQDGNSAIVSMQYSYLPSWISFLVDRQKAKDAGSALINAVYQKWSALPPSERPQLVIAGESLGSFGSEAAFASEQDLLNKTDGALFIGPPNANSLWSKLVKNRDSLSPEWLPVYQAGQNIRFANKSQDLNAVKAQWQQPHIVYLQNASDPIVWWSPKLMYDRPDWLEGKRGPDVSNHTGWYPIVTFWQVVIDLVFAATVPEGHGHRYGSSIPDGWAAIAAPQHWTAADTVKLKSLLAEN